MDQQEEISRLKKQLGLQPHPGGCGLFREMWRGDRAVTFTEPTRHSGSRASGSSIYNLLERQDTISWHRHQSDEGMFWHAGGRVNIHTLQDDGHDGLHVVHVLGDVTKYPDCVGQVVIPHDTYYSAQLADDAQYSLLSAVVMPGFEFEDWSVGNKEDMLKKFPQHSDVINQLASTASSLSCLREGSVQ